MDFFFVNMEHFTHGMTLIFFAMMSFRLYWLREKNRLYMFLFWETVLWMAIQLIDMIKMMDGINDRNYLIGVKLCFDTWCVPLTLFLLMEMTQPRRLNLKKMAILIFPTAFLTVFYIVTSFEITLHILLVYSVVFGLFVVLAVFMVSSQRDNCMKRNFSFTENINVAWIRRVVLLLFSMLAVWVLILWNAKWINDSFSYIFQIAVWCYIYMYSMKHVVDDVPLPNHQHPFSPGKENTKTGEEEQRKPANNGFNSLESKLQQCMVKERLYLNPKLTISDVAMVIGTNRTYLSDYLNNKLGITFSEYINNFRVMEACEILADRKNKHLEEVAECCGFNSLSTFHRAFLKKMAMTPSQFKSTKNR